MSFEVNTGKGRAVTAKQQQWKPCRHLTWDLAWWQRSAFCSQLENLQPFYFHQETQNIWVGLTAELDAK